MEPKTSDQFQPLLNSMVRKPAHHAHGINGFDSCLYCDQIIDESNPGKEVRLHYPEQDIIEHVCLADFLDPEYQKCIAKRLIKVTEYCQ